MKGLNLLHRCVFKAKGAPLLSNQVYFLSVLEEYVLLNWEILNLVDILKLLLVKAVGVELGKRVEMSLDLITKAFEVVRIKGDATFDQELVILPKTMKIIENSLLLPATFCELH